MDTGKVIVVNGTKEFWDDVRRKAAQHFDKDEVDALFRQDAEDDLDDYDSKALIEEMRLW